MLVLFLKTGRGRGKGKERKGRKEKMKMVVCSGQKEMLLCPELQLPLQPSSFTSNPGSSLFFSSSLNSGSSSRRSHFLRAQVQVLTAQAQVRIRANALEKEVVEVKELDELPEQWRRSKVAWLCKILPSYKSPTLLRVLNAQRSWINQQDTTYLILHFMRIRDNDTSFKVYKWMIQRHWFRFDFALATKLADYLGKERKFAKCREVFDDIIRRGRVPHESTFHILTVAYIGAPIQGCLEEACSIYNRMVQLGGYTPNLSLHNALFRAIVSKPRGTSKYYLKQAEFIFHNISTCGFEIHEDVYAGLIWLHSYQDVVNGERIAALRKEMQQAGIEESIDMLVSILRVCSKEGDVEEADKTWAKLMESGANSLPPPQAFVLRMEVFAKVGQPMKSLEIFRGMQAQGVRETVVAYQKIIEVMSRSQEVGISETLMLEFTKSGFKPLLPSFVDVMDMYFNLGMHDKVEWAFCQCLANCDPNQAAYNIYLESLVRNDRIARAEELFNEMKSNGAIGANNRACNIILEAYLTSSQYAKAEDIYDLMGQKKYNIAPPLLEKVDYVLSLSRKKLKKSLSLKLDKEQREILIGLLLGGTRIKSDEAKKNHTIHFEFNENSDAHGALKVHIYERFYEWLTPFGNISDRNDEIPCHFSSKAHPHFGFFADQFWPKRRLVIPKLIHRWLSSRVLAYWYMYGGYTTSSGDILLKLRDCSHEDAERVIKTLKAKSLDCRFKRKGRVFWIACQGNNATWFWKLVEPHILHGFNELLIRDAKQSENGLAQDSEYGLDKDFNFDEIAADCKSDWDCMDSFQLANVHDTNAKN
ncbi:pentatricopeptide repeat-containing protein OTP51, chloroplastic [Amborella trichopoda]|nr:pentatricopeptide repeat-containing protein OTP51, chloroplastic [Amborella trichopoda]|eukprot:XP_006838669.2 pentatricopeptide repeat-containing protein OTP51, chloroplastic [Amborella trichopoda]